jgi:transcriptional regulator with XRE-family HTH domain
MTVPRTLEVDILNSIESIWYYFTDMSAASLLRYARRKANLSQRELGSRAGVTQATISRIEDEKISPRFDTLERLLNVCGFQLQAAPRRGESVDRSAIRQLLRTTPAERARLAVVEARNMERLRPR